ncbi:CHRD domain-containing protein [Roseitranquillus sediminis]|uniref:CHRD domain-containing protein n=1 Tax=Roseitranquillus sediminis TaxID=2809051 RepID=UPI001D0C2FF8|nr:CHRD domain-containing protein [Roseitranquillus sediminis]MBM9595947.1 CHRD domain-containing protein [Roseitranquillus sediminis]
MRARDLILGAAVGGLIAVSGAWAQGGKTYGEKLGFMPVSDVNKSMIGGTGDVQATLDGSTLTVTGEYSGLMGEPTMVSLHEAPMGMAGPKFGEFAVDGGTDGTFEGTVELSDEQIQKLDNNEVYVVVNTERNEDGELRAWLVADDYEMTPWMASTN